LWVAVIVTLATAASVASGTALATPAKGPGAADYTTAPYRVTNNSYAFGQAPVFMPDGRVVFGKDFGTGDGNQVYIVGFTGSGLRCLTCGEPGPNGVPTVRPQGDWILFHSWRGHNVTLGSPGYGGLGTALWIMRPDGSHLTQLTDAQPAGAPPGNGEGYDDYHAYWSPNGKHIVYTHLNWNFVSGGGQGKWDVRVADFVNDSRGPRLTNIRVVRPDDGHWYETQWWAPDGSGFLYTETWGTAMNPELFFCRLTPAGCRTTRLTDNPAWDEQAIFTPDMKDVIFMSSRDHPGFFNTFAQLAQDAGLTTDEDYLLTLPVFEVGFLQPVAQESTDLYELDLRTHSVRRLTTDGDSGWVIPEFTWNPSNRFLMWTETKFVDGYAVRLPLDPVAQLQATAQALQSPPKLPPVSNLTALGATVPILQRTRILQFELGLRSSPSTEWLLARRQRRVRHGRSR
jgi:Tol biopolymer transport system component